MLKINTCDVDKHKYKCAQKREYILFMVNLLLSKCNIFLCHLQLKKKKSTKNKAQKFNKSDTHQV